MSNFVIDPSEIIKMDPKTVRKLQEYRRDVQLVKELKAEQVDESDAFVRLLVTTFFHDSCIP